MKKTYFVIKKKKQKQKYKKTFLLLSHVGFELPTSRMYNKLAAFTNTPSVGSVPRRVVYTKLIDCL